MTRAIRDEQFKVSTPAGPRTMTVRTPSWLCPCPALLLSFSGEARQSLENVPYCIVADVFLAAGHRVAALDLPNHGELEDAHGRQLEGMAAALRAGVDVYGRFAQTCVAAVDQLIERQLAQAGLIAVNGTSRGGLAALHAMAADARISAGAIHASIINLLTLREFAGQENNPLIAANNAAALLDKLVDRPLLITVGEEDPRVSAPASFDFYARLNARARVCPPSLFVGVGVSHGTTYPQHAGYSAAAGFLLQQIAQAMKAQPGN